MNKVATASPLQDPVPAAISEFDRVKPPDPGPDEIRRAAPTNRLRRTLACLCIILASLFGFSPALAEGDFLLFLSADHLERRSVSHETTEPSNFTPTLDALFSYRGDSWRFLAEYFLTDEENELERFQAGYEFSADNTFWLGRFHQPTSAWNTRYHHGAYLQPSISRPAIENWEDFDGIIPMHITGTMLELLQPIGSESGVKYAAVIGIAPVLTDDELYPFDILDPGQSPRKPAASLSVSYHPDYVAEGNIGLTAGYSEIEGEPRPALGLDATFTIDQAVLGAQAVWDRDKWHLISAAYYINSDSGAAPVDVGGWFSSIYAQVQRDLGENTNTYLRIERTGNAANAGYLKLFPGYVIQREMLGFRYDIVKNHALALEISSDKTLQDKYEEFRIQWSAVFP